MDGVHDMGGMDGFGPVDAADDAVFHARWEERAFALAIVAECEGLAAPGFRARIEAMPAVEYLAAPYYGRWLHTAEHGLLAAGAIGPGEVDAWVERLRDGAEEPRRATPAQGAQVVAVLSEGRPLPAPVDARFAVGDVVWVRRMRSQDHSRCPRYLRGCAGVVVRVQCADLPPDGSSAEREPVYAVRFRSDELFGAGTEPAHSVVADLWERYLEPVA
jgi:nitrile hydratase